MIKKRKKKNLKVFFIFLILIIVLIFLAVILPDKDTHPLGDASGPVAYTDPGSIPDYSGEDYFIINNNIPSFTDEDVKNITGEHYSELDSLGRCKTAFALLDRSMMPDEKRGDISEIKPTGYKQQTYEGIIDFDPPYLYNRSHLIAYALTGQNANEKNLIIVSLT